MVNVSAVCTPADASSGGTPMLMRRVLEIWPIGHAQRAIDELRRETDQDERDKCRRISKE